MRRLIFILLAIIGVSQAQTIQYIGAPTTTVISRGNFRTDSIFYLPKRSKAPTDTAAFRYQISDSSLYVWTGSQWIKAGGSGTITGSGITGYLPQFSASTILDTSALFTLGNRLGIGSSTFAYTSTNTANVELNGTAGGILGFKRNDSARGYLWHTGDNMELANTTAGSISFNTNSATRGSISSAGVWRLHNLAGTGDRVVQASSNGTLSATTSVTGLVDTLTLSTRAWRQKGDDSLGAIIATKGSGTVTSVATGYGLSGGTITTTGTLLVDTLNIATRAWRQKGLDSLAALEVSGSGTTNRIPKFTASTTIGNSLLSDDGVELKYTGADGAIVQGTTSAFLSLYGTGDNYIQFKDAAGTAGRIQYNHTSDYMSFNTASAERLRITSGGDVGIGTSSPTGTANRFVNIYGSASNELHLTNATTGTTSTDGFTILQSGNDIYQYNYEAGFLEFGTSNASRLRIFANGRIGVNTTTDAGYQLDVNGTLRSVNGANFATTSGQVGIGKTSPSAKSKLDVEGNIDIADGSFYYLRNAVANTGTYGMYYSNSAPKYPIRLAVNADPTNNRFFEIGWHKNDNKDSTWNPTFSVNSYNAETFINTTTDAGDYKLQVVGNIYNTGSAVLAATSGNVGVGITSPLYKMHIYNTSGESSLFLESGTTTQAALYLANANNAIFNDNSTTNNLKFFVNSATRMTINSAGEILINTTTDAGDYKLQVAGNIYGSGLAVIGNAIINTNSPFVTGANIYTNGQSLALGTQGANLMSFFTNNAERGRINSAGEWIIDASGTDAGDYKLQVVGNARVGTGKLDITTNTAFGLSVSRSGTSVVAGQINNSNGILYYGAESSTGGGLFTGSSAYAAVIGSGAAYPLQFATDNVTRATINTNGELLIATTTDNGDFKLQVNGSALISGSIQTANPVSGTAVPWRLGSVIATNVQLDTANYVEVNINGTFYRLAIVTPL